MKRCMGIILLGLVLSGCRTQQVALDEANHGVALIAELETSLAEFRRLETHALNARAASIREQKDALAFVEQTTKRTMRTRAAVGDTASAKTLQLLLTSTDALALEDAAYLSAIAENEKAVAALMTPLPTTKPSTSAAQTALAELGKELSGDTRRDELLQFWKSVKASVDDARKKIAEAEAQASKSNPQQ